MRFISWNIDSINAALTGTSARAEETRAVLEKIKAAAPDVIAIQETKLSKSGPTKKAPGSFGGAVCRLHGRLALLGRAGAQGVRWDNVPI